MHFTARSLVFSLAALGNLPLGSGRAVQSYGTKAVDLDGSNDVTLFERAVKPIVHDPAIPPAVPAPDPIVPVTPGGDRNPTVPGRDKPETNPVHLAPGDKTPTTPGDKTPETVNQERMNDLEQWCSIDELPAAAAKRDLLKRTGRSCGSRKEVELSDEFLTPYMRERGQKGQNLIDNRKPDATPWSARVDKNYEMKQENLDAEDIEDLLAETPIGKLGVSSKPEDWQFWSTKTAGAKDTDDPLTQFYFTRTQDDHLVAVISRMYAKDDTNRYKLGPDGKNEIDAQGEFVLKPDWEEKSIPVNQLFHENIVKSGKLNPPPKTISFVSRDVSEGANQWPISQALDDPKMAHMKKDNTMTLRAMTPDSIELDYYKRVLGNDNGLAGANTVGRNGAYDNYSPTGIEIWDMPEVGMRQIWTRNN